MTTTRKKPAPPSDPFALSPQNAAKLLDISVDTLERYRKSEETGWIIGAHWFELPSGYRYNYELLKDWLANRHQPSEHLKAIAHFRASLLSSRKKRG